MMHDDDLLQKLKSHVSPWLARIKQFLDWFSTSKDIYKDVLGVDIDNSSILAVRFASSLGKLKLMRAGAEGLPPDVFSEDVVINVSLLGATFRKMVRTHQIKAKNVAMAIPGSKVAIKEVKINGFMSDDEANARAWEEARRTFPELAKNLFLDFEQEKRSDTEYVLVIVVCRREDILPRVDGVAQAGLKAKIMDVDYYAIERAYRLFESQLPPGHQAHYSAIIDFNPHNLTFLVMHKKKGIFHSRQSYTGDYLVPVVQAALKLEVSAQKEKAVEAASIGSPIKLSLSPHSLCDALDEDQKTYILMTIRRLFQSFYSENPGKVVSCVALSGRCALIVGLADYLSDSLEIPVNVVNPLLSVKMSEKVDRTYAMSVAPALVLSCGLALRGVQSWK